MPVTPRGDRSCGLAGRGFWKLLRHLDDVFALIYALIMVAKINHGALLGLCVTVLIAAGTYLYLALKTTRLGEHRVLAIGIGGGLGWIMMMNVWGIIWRINKKLIRWHSGVRGTWDSDSG